MNVCSTHIHYTLHYQQRLPVPVTVAVSVYLLNHSFIYIDSVKDVLQTRRCEWKWGQCKTALWLATTQYSLLCGMKQHIDAIDRYTMTACFRSQHAHTEKIMGSATTVHASVNLRTQFDTFNVCVCVHTINFRQKMALSFLIPTVSDGCMNFSLLLTTNHVHTLPYVSVSFSVVAGSPTFLHFYTFRSLLFVYIQ